MTRRVLIVPSSFKESNGSPEAAKCFAAGILHAAPDAVVTEVPLVGGRENFSEAMVGSEQASLHDLAVTGPVGQPVQARYGITSLSTCLSILEEPLSLEDVMASAGELPIRGAERSARPLQVGRSISA